jgi:hypothetical protein
MARVHGESWVSAAFAAKILPALRHAVRLERTMAIVPDDGGVSFWAHSV